MFQYVAYNNVFHNFAKDACQWDGSVVSRVWFKAFLVDWGNQCLKLVVGEFACVVWLLEDVCDDGDFWFCSFLKDSSWELVWASSFILVDVFQLFNYAVCANIERGHAGVQWRIYYRNGVSFAGEYRDKLAVEGICLSRSFVIGLSFTLRVGIPMFSRLFALINDHNRFGFVFRLSPIWLFT